MSMKRKQLILTLATFLLAGSAVVAQISHGGTPRSWSAAKTAATDVPVVKMPAVDVAALQAEDAINDALKVGPWRFGHNHIVNLGINNAGVWEELKGGDRVWRIAVESPGALSINMEFHEYVLPEGAQVFIYNEDRTEVLGAFTHENNKAHGQLGVTLIQGDKAYVEYFEPANVRGQGALRIGQVTHGYRDLFRYAKGLGDSGNCNNNVICPVGDNWRDQIRSVAIIVVGGSGACTGTLVNNTASDGTPYFLSANHCGTNSTNWVFRFNWESPVCAQNQNGPTNQTVSGGTLRAANAGSDFALHEMSAAPPAGYNVFYSGWDNSGNTPTSQVGIHHPSGDIKKISFDNNSASAVSWGGAACWQVANWEDGTTEPGSSGSGLWDQNGRLIGQLYGGSASCQSNTDDNYGRFDVSWNGASSSTRLRDWLDPGNTGNTTDDGYDPNGAQFQYDAAIQSVSGVDPSICNANTIAPVVTIKNNGTDPLTSLNINYQMDGGTITTLPWTGNLAPGATTTFNIPTITVTDGQHTLTVFSSDPNGNSDQNTGNDTRNVSFFVVTQGVSVFLDLTLDDYGSETTWEFSQGGNVLASGGPYSDGADGTLITEEVCLGNGCYDFTIYDDYGDGICCGYGNGSYEVNDGMGTVYVTGDGQFTNDETTNFCITGLGVDEASALAGVSIYPNPSNGNINVDLSELDASEVTVTIYNTIGAVIQTETINAQGQLLNYDLTTQSNGLYMVEVRTAKEMMVKKIQVNK